MFRAYLNKKEDGERLAIVRSGGPLYFVRQATFIREMKKIGHNGAENRIIKNALDFHKHYKKFTG